MRAILATVRYWGPIVAALGCLFAASMVGVIAAWLLIIAAFLLLLDAGTAMFERAGSTGNLWTHKQ
jgi:hypothetical protein